MLIAVCDDELSAVDSLTNKISKNCPSDISVTIDTFQTGAALIASAASKKYDCIFLDILIEEENGIDVARKLREDGYKNLLIFLSNTEFYALKGYSVNAYGYYIKPIEAETISVIFDALREQSSQSKILISSGRRLISLSTSEIYYIESIGKTVKIVTKEEAWQSTNTMYNLEGQLDSRFFVRCHKGYIVNMNHIKEIKASAVTLSSGTELPLGRTYKNEVRSRFLAYLRI